MAEALEDLRRWESSGGEWELDRMDESGIALRLLSCDRLAAVGRWGSADADAVDHVLARLDAERGRVPVGGLDVDARTGCAHYRGTRDLIALRFPCCDRFYACHACHEARADHPGEPWPFEHLGRPIVLCGACGIVMSARDYLGAGDACPACGTGFNPGCRLHHHLYFASPG